MSNDISAQKWQSLLECLGEGLLSAGYKMGDYTLLNEEKLNKGGFLSYISEITSVEKSDFKVGFAYQLAITTDTQCSTYELSITMPVNHLLIMNSIKEKGYKKFIMISNIHDSDFTGVSFDGLKNFIKVAVARNPTLIGSITILPHGVSETVMNFYSSIIPKISGVKKLKDSLKITIDLLKKA